MRRTAVEQLFDRLNAELFAGRVRTCTVRRAPYLERAYACDGLYEPMRNRILLQSGLPPPAERRVLIHEMCHAALPTHAGHGKPFLEQLHRLARRGEAWADREARRYATDRWLRTMDELDDLDRRWHALPASAPERTRELILCRADRLLVTLAS